jgi:hypothetical protein
LKSIRRLGTPLPGLTRKEVPPPSGRPVGVESAQNVPQVQLPTYLSRDPNDSFTGAVTGEPRREDVPFVVDEAAIVEFYAR